MRASIPGRTSTHFLLIVFSASPATIAQMRQFLFETALLGWGSPGESGRRMWTGPLVLLAALMLPIPSSVLRWAHRGASADPVPIPPVHETPQSACWRWGVRGSLPYLHQGHLGAEGQQNLLRLGGVRVVAVLVEPLLERPRHVLQRLPLVPHLPAALPRPARRRGAEDGTLPAPRSPPGPGPCPLPARPRAPLRGCGRCAPSAG